MSRTERIHLFAGFGIELEYMIVDQTSLKALPISDKVLKELAGANTREVSLGEVAWSNELVMHVIEIKSDGPARDLAQLHRKMFQAVSELNQRLARHGAMLLPTSMHPLFVPEQETKLWTDEDATIYRTYDRIFNCSGHGWSNLQSIHINLPFYDDTEFGLLHAAIRAVLPILPALAASSPLVEGKPGPYLDSRLFYYLQNQRRIPSVIGPAIPERVFSEADYKRVILEPMYNDIKGLDPDDILQDEWLNSRAAIARFSRHAIEIRILDIGECLRSDFAIISFAVSLIKQLVNERWVSQKNLQKLDELMLRQQLDKILVFGLDHVIDDPDYLAVFGLAGSASTRDLWLHVTKECLDETSAVYKNELNFLLTHGCAARRILNSLGPNPSQEAILTVYHKIATSLKEDKFFAS